MIRIVSAALALLWLAPLVPALAAGAAPAPYDDEAMRPFVDGLLQRMTIEEKVGQLTILGADSKDLEQLIREGKVGGTNGVLQDTDVLAYTHHMQQLAMQSRLKIPLWFMGDVCHGFATLFPVPLAMAASWDPALVEQVDRAAAVEATAAGVDWTFCPMVDISRDPRWGRVVEGAGEDPFLGNAMAEAQVRGFQGDDLAAPDTMMATVKHFAGYGAVQAGRDYNSAWIPPRESRDVYLPPYRAAVDAGAGSVMAAFVALDYVPATADRRLLTGILRDQWGFKGLVVSDYDAIPELQQHGIARDPAEAARLALHAGVDIDLHSGTYLNELPALVRGGKVPEAELDAAVRRVLVAKYKLGLFDDPFRYGDRATAKRVTLSPRHRDLARRIARESMVLLENRNGSLPLQRRGRIAVIGPLAGARETLQGPMPAVAKPRDVVTILDGIREVAGKGVEVAFAKGVDVDSDDTSGIRAAVQLAKSAGVAVLVLGEDRPMIGEGNSRAHIGLPGRQLELAKAVKAAGVPIVVVLVNGRPLTIPWLHEHADAVLEAWLPGDEGGHAVADLLFGDEDPSGKLPITFPRTLGQVPIHYAHLATGRPFDPAQPAYTSRYVDVPNTPLYPFGYGLSYTTFDLGPVQLDRQALAPGGSLHATVRVTNTGNRAGTEVAQLYIRDEVADVSRPVRQLRGFQRVTLAPGESRSVTFTIRPAMLAFHRLDMSFGTEPGRFDVYVGADSRASDHAAFMLEGRRQP
ncbi:MAG TPA: glycoside hydrolase family 3 N-terminal domain-containing protein [Rhodanobacteraceae bacterium]|nr:glycoside hydrolase family 3 N-terminal domain-containing protein [Rhodanobacteraceae bacterium]